MDAKQFLAEFGHIANAPGGVQRLREMIYQLAVTGLLSQQVEDAKSLLQKIELERERLIKKGKYKRIPKLEKEPLLVARNISIPKAWVWTRLLDIGEISPKNKLEDEEGKIADFIPMSGISELHKAVLVSEVRGWNEIKKGYTHFANNDVVVAKITPCFENGKAAVIRGLQSELGIGAGTTELHVVRMIHEGVLPDYVYIFLRSPYFKVEGEKNMTGTAGQKRLPTEFFATYPFPLPPTEEQSRIVAKVDELMALCDKLEAQQQKKRQLQNKLRQSVLQAVANAESPKELQDSWGRLAGNFSHLFAEAEDVEELRSLILDLAVSGKLLTPDMFSKTQTGKDVLTKIEHLRKLWMGKAKDQELKEAKAMFTKLRNQRVNFPIDVIPQHWQWVTLLQAAQVVIDCDHKTPQYVENGIHLIRTTDIRNGIMNLSNTRKVSDEGYRSRSRRLTPKAGDIFFTREAPMGEAALVPKCQTVCLGQRLMLIRVFEEVLDNQFVIYAIRSPSFQKRLSNDAVGMTVKHINVKDVENLFIPLPPRQEQALIVQQLNQFMLQCDSFGVQLRSAQKTAERLATAAIASLTGISTPQQEEPMKVPQTELKAPVRLGTAQPPSNMQAPLASLLARHNGEMGANDLWQRFGGEVDAFYAQLKTEVMHGWIAEPTGAQMLEKEAD
ncbi:restriction endonuclease subunit S [Candidatus Thiothrix sp. Deng01]|uniref:Restriction endonuclease subunit S n=1 Tax=Candidatus Thiothrix phosphatis TaxID=3112415 RepID=A0ABU6D1Q1_9GAMM|nr:restriction endonuclease subunit S [Candidatus Thiothrix sp. Deng01]MEB4592613.1 restriction endonuclease subunit S [Candidatus Thiothrix sp. Deng01]